MPPISVNDVVNLFSKFDQDALIRLVDKGTLVSEYIDAKDLKREIKWLFKTFKKEKNTALLPVQTLCSMCKEQVHVLIGNVSKHYIVFKFEQIKNQWMLSNCLNVPTPIENIDEHSLQVDLELRIEPTVETPKAKNLPNLFEIDQEHPMFKLLKDKFDLREE